MWLNYLKRGRCNSLSCPPSQPWGGGGGGGMLSMGGKTNCDIGSEYLFKEHPDNTFILIIYFFCLTGITLLEEKKTSSPIGNNHSPESQHNQCQIWAFSVGNSKVKSAMWAVFNSSDSSCLSWLTASVTSSIKIWSKLNGLWHGHVQIWALSAFKGK